MKQPTIEAIIDKNKIASDRVWLFAATIRVKDVNENLVETVYIVRNNEDVTLDGQVFQALPFDIDKTENAGEIANIAIAVQDQTRFIQTKMQQYNGLINSEVDLHVTMLDAGSTVGDIQPDLTESYVVMGSSTSDYVTRIELGVRSPLDAAVPARIQSKDRCSFRYKSAECGYSGGLASCDFTLDGPNGCVAHSNEDRFGAYPAISLR